MESSNVRHAADASHMQTEHPRTRRNERTSDTATSLPRFHISALWRHASRALLIASLLLGSLHANTAEAQQPGNNEFTHGNLLSTNGDVELNWRGVVFSPPFTQDYKYILTVDGVDKDVWSILNRPGFPGDSIS
jgi:hypothetical protein